MSKFIQHQDLSVELILSPRRKTMALQVKQGKVEVRMPKHLPQRFAESFVANKYDWIKVKLAAQPTIQPLEFNDSDTLPFLGQMLILKNQASLQNKVQRIDDELRIESKIYPAERIHKQKWLEKWYRQQAETILLKRCEKISQQIGLFPGKISVRSYKGRWGSCNSKGEIKFNWKLVMAPVEVIDYVIIHELCHLEQHNHSPAFWQLVAHFKPDYKIHRLWLKQHGHQLSL